MKDISWYLPKTNPYNHQKDTLIRSWDKDGYGWLLEMGCGKSKIGVDNICMLREKMNLKRVLIIAPKGVYQNWVSKEIPTHMPERHTQDMVLHLWNGGGSQTELRQIDELMREKTKMVILVMNIEALAASVKASAIADKFVALGDCMIMVDESSTIKNPQAKRTKKLISLAKRAKWRRIATGTPVSRSPLDLWSQFEFLKPNCLGFKTFTSFKARYAITDKKEMGGRVIDIVVGHRNTDELSREVAKFASVVRKEDAIDLPPKVYTTRPVELTVEQKRMYLELKKWATTEINEGRFTTATEIVVQLLRLHQIVCGYAVDESKEMHEIPSNRVKILMEVLDEIQDKTIVWCAYRKDIENVYKALVDAGYRVVQYHGGTDNAERQEAIRKFQDSNEADIFLGTPHAGGYGITLTSARAVVYYSNNYDLEKRQQSEDRAHRIGQTRSVTYVDLVAAGTVDEKIIEALKKKENLANLVMDGPARIRDLMGEIK